MKNSRRNPKLDKVLGKEVEILFFDGSTKEGILTFNDFGSGPHSGYYQIGSKYFRKSHVSGFREKGCEEWKNLRLERYYAQFRQR